MEPIRELSPAALATVAPEAVRPLKRADFTKALGAIRPSVSQPQLRSLEVWTEQFGTA